MLAYQLIRSKRRKTLVLQVKYGQVTVRAPHSVSSSLIDSFVQEKSAWLQKKIAEQQTERLFCDFTQGSRLLVLGVNHRLNIGIAKQANVHIDQCDSIADNTLGHLSPNGTQVNVLISAKINARLITSSLKATQVKKQLEKYFKQAAEQVITQRLEQISQEISLTPTHINIRQYRARWGSCNNRGEVSFNYLLMMTPLFVIDYVIVHELCHLAYLNHSKSFWDLVEKHCPNYKTAKAWLRNNQTQLHWQSQ